MDADAAGFANRVLTWYRRYGRRDLPWQREDAYRIWLSEIMLQQTQVSTVIPYYQNFLKRFPNIRRLADASIDDVLPFDGKAVNEGIVRGRPVAAVMKRGPLVAGLRRLSRSLCDTGVKNPPRGWRRLLPGRT